MYAGRPAEQKAVETNERTERATFRGYVPSIRGVVLYGKVSVGHVPAAYCIARARIIMQQLAMLRMWAHVQSRRDGKSGARIIS